MYFVCVIQRSYVVMRLSQYTEHLSVECHSALKCVKNQSTFINLVPIRFLVLYFNNKEARNLKVVLLLTLYRIRVLSKISALELKATMLYPSVWTQIILQWDKQQVSLSYKYITQKCFKDDDMDSQETRIIIDCINITKY